ncbi:hypothetical protein NUU61_001142 [Penicillium alfredii]|uniref:Guanine nucleotide exchange factor n=1 Tax=Penicillium alfredii TaxID=1506179 RepID=A0A9W9GBF1_9EURO|nr:uncharacterized protein NUU61_001142 [Penicillium alfredii]KAJ5115383.1 hypothetical protein NUU61_001142 [Penicillium alfredii]
MEPFPSPVDPPAPSKEPNTPRVRIDELPTLDRTRSGGSQNGPSTLRRANTVQGSNLIKRNLELKATHERTATTGLRAKDSNELLRQGPLQRSQTQRGPLGAPPRAGRQAILQPIANPTPKAHRIAPLASVDQAKTNFLQPQGHAFARDDPSRWSSSQLSELRPREEPRDIREPAVPQSAQLDQSIQSRLRSNSNSASDEESVPEAGKREMRIVIDRSEDRPKSAEQKSGHAASEAIPRPRLTSPRFKTDKSAALQSSGHTRTSMSDNFRNSTLLGGMADPLLTHRSSVYGRDSMSRQRSSFAVSMFSGTAAIDLSRASPIPRNSVVYELKEPVEPSIYENLVSGMDDGSVVRYIPGTKDMSAATPARIVAQISSESFMDYELVSDFFLTFRSYLSTGHLLALLLARLHWAINRLKDDGRIIRIRTFAALRHWILNYFVDDFVTNYDLRTHFCDTINTLYREVKSRDFGGMSDLKILIDLKRCWNGKCSVYWTASDFSRAYNDPDTPIVPGSAQIELPSADVPQQSFPLPGMVPNPDSNSHESLRLSTQHDRNDSAGTAQSIPFSTQSDQSMQVLSCSLPPKSAKHQSVPFSKGKAPRPVPLGLTKVTPSSHEPPPVSPIISRHPFHGHGHKRSGSFSDSVRDDRVPMFVTEPEAMVSATQDILDPVSLIRGELYPPAESYMTMMAPDSPPLAPPSTTGNPDRRSTPDTMSKPALTNSGMRTILGSIKRVLHTRNGGQSISARIANSTDAVAMLSRGKTSAMPTHLAFGSDIYRERKLAAGPKHLARIDILCDEVLKQYRQVVKENEAREQAQQSAEPGLQPTQETAQNPTESETLQIPNAGNTDIKSGITTDSGSIVIVDDTGFDIPVMSGAAPESTLEVTDEHGQDTSNDRLATDGAPSHVSTLAEGQYLLPIYYSPEESGANAQRSSSLRPSAPSTPRRSFSVERGSTPCKTPLSLRLRKYASFQSGISRKRLSIGSEAGQSAGAAHPMQNRLGKFSGPALRRRPGGNLRQMQTGDEHGATPGRASFISDYSYDDSLTGTTTYSEDTASRPMTTLIPPNPRFSLIHTRSSRHLRRSFEAAIAQFAQIPDDDDGGIESTLLKLEGKWGGSSDDDQGPASGQADDSRGKVGRSDARRGQLLTQPGVDRAERDHPDWDVLPRRRQTDKSAYSTVAGRLAPPRPYSDSVAESEESYNSIPLLERGLTDESMKRPPTARHPHNDPHGPPLSFISSRDMSELASSHPSIQIIKETESLRRIPRGSTAPSYALRDAGAVTPKRLSALSVDMIEAHEAAGARRSPYTQSLSSSTVDIPPHPLAHPPSPPMTIQKPGSFTLNASPLDPVLFQARPLTPETSPRHRDTEKPNSRLRNVQQVSSDVLSNSERNHYCQDTIQHPGPDHVPFVLACESHVLAQQLTLVEMAALSEVDWRDLVEMNWSSCSPYIMNWVQFLTSEDRKGIDLVVGRFNIMVKWVLSEIVLTRDIHERVRTIIKYIHTAAHARRICNYATMLQIAIALSSSDCSRLQDTWQLVPLEDRRLFKDMECLIQPVRNFHDLRVEMETANLQEGCIPFIGLYVHDLTYNSQKPAQINGNGGGMLVNFERYRTTARIVKNLLRLIDASTKYRFEPVQGIIERCLWIASLPEDEIQARSKNLV